MLSPSATRSATPRLAVCSPAHLVGTWCVCDSPDGARIVRSRTPNGASAVTVPPAAPPAPGAERACPGQACGQREPRPLSLLPLPARPDPPPPRVSPGSGRSQQALDREVPSQPPRLPRGIAASLRPGFPRGHLRHTRLSGLGVLGWPPCPDRLAPCRDGLPYCEADYHAEFGVRCDGCEKFITGHVLEVSGRCGPRRLSPTPS